MDLHGWVRLMLFCVRAYTFAAGRSHFQEKVDLNYSDLKTREEVEYVRS